jgi:hypothetical protein
MPCLLLHAPYTLPFLRTSVVVGEQQRRYSHSMLLRLIQGLLLALAAISGTWQIMIPGGTPKPASWVWIGFLVGLPIVLAALIRFHQRGAAMVIVMYATIGLALDIATLVQEVSRPEGGLLILAAALVSGAINFLLIACGGQAVLGQKWGDGLGVARRPNPPSPFSS